MSLTLKCNRDADFPIVLSTCRLPAGPVQIFTKHKTLLSHTKMTRKKASSSWKLKPHQKTDAVGDLEE